MNEINSVVRLLDLSAEKYSNKILYEDSDKTIRFVELRKLARIIATRLIREKDKKKEIAPVLVYMSKSVDALTAFMGVLYSGSPYVPIDVNMPIARLQKILNNLRPSAVITDSIHYKNLFQVEIFGAKSYVFSDISSGEIDDNAVNKVVDGVIDTDPIYIMYTSGSTGEPKGVTVSHRGVIDYASWLVETFGFDENTVMGNQAPLYFDNSVFDIYGCLLCGGRAVLIPDSLLMFPIKLPEFLEKHEITSIFWVPTVMINVANSGVLKKYPMPKLKNIAFCGEVMPNTQLNIWRREHPDAKYANLYGPTEITDVCTYYVVDREFEDSEPLPIGCACRNMRAIILTEDNQCAKQGESGELCIIGSGVALGYWGKKNITDSAFIQNPLNSNYREIIYRTGDLAFEDKDGLIIIQGRLDSQIKFKGNRIELGEIEKAAMCLEGVENACALFNETKGEITLFLQTKEELILRKVKMALLKFVPRYMLPQRLVTIKQFPHTANGKIDRVGLRKTYF